MDENAKIAVNSEEVGAKYSFIHEESKEVAK